MTVDLERGFVDAGGHRLSYLTVPETAADTPADASDRRAVVVLLHGLASDAETFDRLLHPLARHGVRPIALDLLGHGRSDKPAHSELLEPYLLEDFAGSVVAFLDALDIRRATLVGHSLGGAIAMAVAHLSPERVQGLVLASAGGLGHEVHAVLRAAALPIAPAVLRAMTRPRLRRLYTSPGVHRALRLTPDNLVNLRRAGRALGTDEGQASFFAALRGVIEPHGQRGSFIEMDRLSRELPTLLLWNEGDPVIPVAHARAAAAHLPGARLVVFTGGGHEPHRRNAARVADEVAALVASTSRE